MASTESSSPTPSFERPKATPRARWAPLCRLKRACVPSFAHRPHVSHPRGGNEQAHTGVAHPERSKLLQLLGQLEPQPGPTDHRIDPLGAPQVLGAKHRSSVRGKGGTEGIEILGSQLQPGSRPVPPKALQMLATGFERGKQVEPRNAPPRTPPSPLTVKRNHHDGPVMPLDQPRSDDPDNAGMPTLAGQDQTHPIAQLVGQLPQRPLGSSIDFALRRPTLTVGPTQLRRNLSRTPLVLGEEQLHSRISSVQAPRSIDPRRQPKSQITLVKLAGLTFRGFEQRPHPRPTSPPNLSQPPPHQRTVLSNKRHHIGDRRERDEVEVMRNVGGGFPRLAFARSSWGAHPRRSSQRRAQLPGDRRTAEMLEGIAINAWMQDRTGGKLSPGLMVVRHNDVHPERLEPGRPRRPR